MADRHREESPDRRLEARLPVTDSTGAATAAPTTTGRKREPMPDFTAYRHPVLAVPCPTCAAEAGAWCRRPSGHRANHLHADRRTEADAAFIKHHGETASIERTAEGWRVAPCGRIRD